MCVYIYIYIYMHLLVCYLNKLQNARCNDKDAKFCFSSETDQIITLD